MGQSSSPGTAKNLLFSSRGTIQPPIQLVPGTLSPGVKRQGPETDNLFPEARRGLERIGYRGALLSALLRATVYVFTQFAKYTG
jgi:hypothetical protein